MTSTVVTGGAGFLGSHLVDALVKRGVSVVVVDNLVTGRLANLGAAISTGRVTFVYADCATDAASMRAVFSEAGVRGIDAIYHLASPSCPDMDETHAWEAVAVNVSGTLSLIDVAVENNARFIFASTAELSGDPHVGSSAELDPALVDAHACYLVSKRFGESAVAAAVRERGLDGRIVRFANCYGPRMPKSDARLIPMLMDAALNRRPLEIPIGANQTLSLTYVTDAVDALRLVGEHRDGKLPPLDIGPDAASSIRHIAESIAAQAPAVTVIEHGRQREHRLERRLDVRGVRALGWRPAMPVEDGLRRTFRWYATENHLFV